MKNKHKLLKLALAVLGSVGALTPVYAEGDTNSDTNDFVQFEEAENMPIITKDTGDLTVRYFDDSEETTPVEGAEFTIYKVANIGRSQVNGTNGAYLPLDETLTFEGVDNAEVYEEAVLAAYEAGLEDGYTATAIIGNNGEAYFKNIPIGAYLVTETKTLRYHIRSTSFLVSVPETNEEGTSWNFDVVCNPKQVLAGDLTVTKKIKGKDIKKDATYHVKVEFEAEGSYKAKLPNGTETTVKNGDEIAIQANQTLFIYDLPAGAKYTVNEVEANGTGYDTSYKNQEGNIEAYSGIGVTVINDSTKYDTGAGYSILYYLIGGAGALTILLFLLVTNKKNKHSEN